MKKDWLLKVHIICVFIIITHLVFKWLFDFGLAETYIFTIKVLAILTGVFLIFFHFKQVWLRLYFKMYGCALILFLAGFIFQGFLGGLLTSVLQYPVIRDEIAYKYNKITIYRKYEGAFSFCCTYRVTEKRYFIFEKTFGEFQVLGQSDFLIKTIENSPQRLKITYPDFVFDHNKNDLVLKYKSLIFNK